MKITAIVPTKNSARTLATCLESLVNQTYGDTEVIVVDNQSDDDTVRIAEQLADVVIDQGPERCAQRNKGAEVATGDIVLFIDSDMVLEPDVLSEIAHVFQTRPDGRRSHDSGALVRRRLPGRVPGAGEEPVRR